MWYSLSVRYTINILINDRCHETPYFVTPQNETPIRDSAKWD